MKSTSGTTDVSTGHDARSNSSHKNHIPQQPEIQNPSRADQETEFRTPCRYHRGAAVQAHRRRLPRSEQRLLRSCHNTSGSLDLLKHPAPNTAFKHLCSSTQQTLNPRTAVILVGGRQIRSGTTLPAEWPDVARILKIEATHALRRHSYNKKVVRFMERRSYSFAAHANAHPPPSRHQHGFYL